MERSCSFQPSAVSASSSSSSLQDICRFCLCEALPDSPLISPCHCTGSMRYVHQSCLQQWIKSSDTRFCELCKFHFIMHIKMKPLRKWKKLDMSPVEKRDLRNTIFILIITVTYCGGKLYEMIKGTKQNVHGNFWKSWIEFIIDALISLGMLIFLCLSLMSFMLLFWRWKVFNSIIYVQNAPENTRTRQQQHPDDSATELTTNALTRECTKQSSKDENELQGCQSCSNSNTVDDTEDTSHKTSSVEIGSSKSTLTSLPDQRMDHTHPPLTQVLVISSTFDPMCSTDERTCLTSGVSNV